MAYKYTDSQGIIPKEADKVLKAFRFAQDSFLTARQESERAVRYLNNDTWTSSEKSNATKYKKPLLKYNNNLLLWDSNMDFKILLEL